jgi:hypothetical protein
MATLLPPPPRSRSEASVLPCSAIETAEAVLASGRSLQGRLVAVHPSRLTLVSRAPPPPAVTFCDAWRARLHSRGVFGSVRASKSGGSMSTSTSLLFGVPDAVWAHCIAPFLKRSDLASLATANCTAARVCALPALDARYTFEMQLIEDVRDVDRLYTPAGAGNARRRNSFGDYDDDIDDDYDPYYEDYDYDERSFEDLLDEYNETGGRMKDRLENKNVRPSIVCAAAAGDVESVRTLLKGGFAVDACAVWEEVDGANACLCRCACSHVFVFCVAA